MSKAHAQQATRQQLDERSQQVEALLVLLTEKDEEIMQLKKDLQGAVAAAKEELKSEAEQKIRQKLAMKVRDELREKMTPEVRAELKDELRTNIVGHLSEEQIAKYFEKPLAERARALESEMEERIAEQVEQRLQKEVAAQVGKEKAAFRNKISEATKTKSKDNSKAEEQRLRVQIATLESKHLCEVQTLNREITNLKKRISGYETTIELLRSQATGLAAELSDTQKALKMAAESLADQHEREERLKRQLVMQEAQTATLTKQLEEQRKASLEDSEKDENKFYTIRDAHVVAVANVSAVPTSAISPSQELAPAVDLNSKTAVFMPNELSSQTLSTPQQSSLPTDKQLTKVDEIWTNENFERAKQTIEVKMRSSCTSSPERILQAELENGSNESDPKIRTTSSEAPILPMSTNMPIHVSGDIGFSAIGTISMNSSVDLEQSPGTSTGPVVELPQDVIASSMFGQSSLSEYLGTTPVANAMAASKVGDTLPLTKISPTIILRKSVSPSELQATMVKHFSDELREQTKFMESSPLQIPDGQLGNLIESAIQFLFKVWDYIEEAFSLRNSCLNSIRSCLEQNSLDSALKLAQVELLRCKKVKQEFGDIFELVREREQKKVNEENIADVTSTLQAVLNDCDTELLYRGFPYSDIIRAESS